MRALLILDLVEQHRNVGPADGREFAIRPRREYIAAEAALDLGPPAEFFGFHMPGEPLVPHPREALSDNGCFEGHQAFPYPLERNARLLAGLRDRHGIGLSNGGPHLLSGR